MKIYPEILILPDVHGEHMAKQCVICGGMPSEENPEIEITCGNGCVSMTTDNDLCLECAVWFWRAFKHAHKDGTRAACIRLLEGYPPVSDEVKAQALEMGSLQ